MNMHLREGRSFTREFVEVPGGFRRTVEDAIEGLIAVLDQLDADPDLEDGGYDEPTLGWPETGSSGPHGLRKLDWDVVRQEDGELEQDIYADEGAQRRTLKAALQVWTTPRSGLPFGANVDRFLAVTAACAND